MGEWARIKGTRRLRAWFWTFWSASGVDGRYVSIAVADVVDDADCAMTSAVLK